MGDAQQIVVSYDLLEQSASSLRAIGEEFEHTATNKRDLAGHLGSADIADAMDDFSGNWDRKRKNLTQKIQETERLIRSVMVSFREQDRQGANFDFSAHAGPMMTTTETTP